MLEMQFSIVTPSFRSSKWLRLCIEAVADQQVSAEHIVQDANSDDGTIEFLTRDSRVTAVVEEDSGMYDAINRGLRRAKGEFLAHLNADEQYLPGALQMVMDHFRRNPDIDIILGDVIVTDSVGGFKCYRKSLRPLLLHTQICELSTFTCATFFRRKVIDGGEMWFNPNLKYVGDADWMCRLIRKKYRIGLLREYTSTFTQTGRNLSLSPKSLEEQAGLLSARYRLARFIRPAVVLHHRARRFFNGVYSQPPFSYSIYTQGSPNSRVNFYVPNPTFKMRW